jgi:hypothetical protein
VILGKIHEVHNKPVNVADDIEKEVHVVGNVDLGTDAVKAIGSYKSVVFFTKMMSPYIHL